MKKIFTLSLVLLSNLVIAASSDMTWDQIRGMWDVVRFPNIQVLGVFVSYDKFCVAGDMLIADSNYKPCIEWSNPVGEQDAVCLKYDETAVMETPVNYIDQVCTNWIEKNDNVYCEKYEAVESTYPLTVKASVSVMVGSKPSEKFLFNKEYTIPECK